jgi:hypothetical protein
VENTSEMKTLKQQNGKYGGEKYSKRLETVWLQGIIDTVGGSEKATNRGPGRCIWV